ncbi:aminotransferase class I/II-fold pyridoxal phosphate-dependent enzyme [Pararhodospirillum photometricum]|uniref:aminotransferase class I/II-fold pyridoxal phosphate-dependent enzyme n=1 Tax=Pararhodospirillum photometricum TaxID=1084 RepID=UPI0018D33837|nr:aminotransferase class I/II-fold pyridoxal phosphate-dependent enzyme [Pararhodospirillum photometricum]
MLYFNSGYTANLAVLSTLPRRGDLIVYDTLIHASAHAGIKAGRAHALAVPHNDANAIATTLERWRQAGGRGVPWIVVESLYSMDGDPAPLADLALIAQRHDAFLVIDEAHATGVLGPQGRGLAAALEGQDNVIVVHTCGKALGTTGALVGAPAVLCDTLVAQARPFLYATAPSPLQAALVRAALALVAQDDGRRARLADMVAQANQQLGAKTGRPGSGSHILPVIVGDNARAVALANRLQARGFDVRAIRPPTVPLGTARLRLSLTLHADEAAVAALTTALAEELACP